MRNLILSIVSLTIFFQNTYSQTALLDYTIDLDNISNDTFKVTLDIDKLSKKNNIYHFAATAPGTYSIMDIGRFASNFKAFDKKGRELPTTKLSVNQYQLTKSKKVKKITYEIAETWDTKVDQNKVLEMSGTSIEKDHVLLNAHCVLGYLDGMQAQPLSIKINYPDNWEAGTALTKSKDGSYFCEDYDHAVDSPILLGRLSKASTTLNGTAIDIYTYSKTDLIKSEQLLASMSEMLNASAAFIEDFPVDRYTFLYHFEDISLGAWEHSYSSGYVLAEQPYNEELAKTITDMAYHEFFHIITPLNIHSEIIQQFDFEDPKPTQHLWFYEGTTEWASKIMQLRYGAIPLPVYFRDLKQKLTYDEMFDQSYSLLQLSLNSYTPEGKAQYVNIYMRGALVAGLLDIKLLELSDGKRGLREVINELSKIYGPNRAFKEDEFFSIFTNLTYPEIGDFFDQYIKNANPLPIKEYYNKLGINYEAEKHTGEMKAIVGGQIGVPDGKIVFMKLNDELAAFGIEVGDELKALNGVEISLANGRQELGALRQKPIGEDYTITIDRNGEALTFDCKMLSQEEVIKHTFSINEEASEQQIALREQWLKNL